MKKIILTLALGATLFSLGTFNISANEINEIDTKKYVKSLKTYIKKNEFIELEKEPTIIFSPIDSLKVKNKGVQLGYLEPTIKDIKHNIELTNELKSFLQYNCTKNEKINSIGDDMIVVLDEIHSNLSNALVEFTNQLGFDTKDSEKIANLSGKYNCFSSEKKTCAYDYINMINDRIEKVEKMYEYIKDIS